MSDFFSTSTSTILSFFEQQISLHLLEISASIIACILVLFGHTVNNIVRRLIYKQHFVIRTAIFIALNAFGYGLIIVTASPYLAKMFASFRPEIMILSIFSCFIFIGVWAQRSHV